MACANKNAPHTNNSQFFITLDRCDHLDRKNTIFGKITGESIYNAMRLNEQEVRQPAHVQITRDTLRLTAHDQVDYRPSPTSFELHI